MYEWSKLSLLPIKNMSFITLVLLALSVSADAFAVAIGMSISAKTISKKDIAKLALVCGGFQ